MRLRYFFIDACTDSRIELDDEQIRRLEKRHSEMLAQDRGMMWLILISVAATVVGAWIIGPLIADLVNYFGGGPVLRGIVTGGGTMLILLIAWFMLYRRVLRRSIRRALRDCGFDICIKCGYELTGLDDDALCPECGAEREPMKSESASTE